MVNPLDLARLPWMSKEEREEVYESQDLSDSEREEIEEEIESIEEDPLGGEDPLSTLEDESKSSSPNNNKQDEETSSQRGNSTVTEDESEEMDDGGLSNERLEAVVEEYLEESGAGQDVSPETMSRIEELEEDVRRLNSRADTFDETMDEIQAIIEDHEDNMKKLLDIYSIVTEGVNPFEQSEGPAVEGSSTDFNLIGESDEGSVEETAPEARTANDLFEENDEERSEGTEEVTELEEPPAEVEEFEEPVEEVRDSEPERPSRDTKSEPQTRPEREKPRGDTVPPTQGRNQPRLDQLAESRPQSPEDLVSDVHPPTDLEMAERDIYLDNLPASYEAELMVMKWITYLYEEAEGEYAEVVVAIKFYETIGWISEEVKNELYRFIEGLSEFISVDDPPNIQHRNLDKENHAQSLIYISNIAEKAKGDEGKIENSARILQDENY